MESNETQEKMFFDIDEIYLFSKTLGASYCFPQKDKAVTISTTEEQDRLKINLDLGFFSLRGGYCNKSMKNFYMEIVYATELGISQELLYDILIMSPKNGRILLIKNCTFQCAYEANYLVTSLVVYFLSPVFEFTNIEEAMFHISKTHNQINEYYKEVFKS